MGATGPVDGRSEPAVEAAAPGPLPRRRARAMAPGVATGGRQLNTGRWAVGVGVAGLKEEVK